MLSRWTCECQKSSLTQGSRTMTVGCWRQNVERAKTKWTRDGVLDEVMLRGTHLLFISGVSEDMPCVEYQVIPLGLVRSWRYDVTPCGCDLGRCEVYEKRVWYDDSRVITDIHRGLRCAMSEYDGCVRGVGCLGTAGCWVCGCFVVVLVSCIHFYSQRLVPLVRWSML